MTMTDLPLPQTLPDDKAQTLSHAWSNFDLELSLRPLKNAPHPFYVRRPDNPLANLKHRLLRGANEHPKVFFSGLRGSGKSTELLHLHTDAALRRAYWPIFFSIRDDVSPQEVDHRDILLAIARHIYRALRQQGYGAAVSEPLRKKINAWNGRVQEEIVTRLGSRFSGLGINVTPFNLLGLQIDLEPKERKILRRVIDENLLDLIALLNELAEIAARAVGRRPLILIDDLDKPEYAQARKIFHEKKDFLLRPQIAIVYTVSSNLFFDDTFVSLQDHAELLPNILVERWDAASRRVFREEQGYAVLREFVMRRMDDNLIEPSALEALIRFSGGVFREAVRLMRSAISSAMRARAGKVRLADVQQAVNLVGFEYQRMLRESDWEVLRRVYRLKSRPSGDSLRFLLQSLAILQYQTIASAASGAGRPAAQWFDVHPALRRVLDENTA